MADERLYIGQRVKITGGTHEGRQGSVVGIIYDSTDDKLVGDSPHLPESRLATVSAYRILSRDPQNIQFTATPAQVEKVERTEFSKQPSMPV